MKGYTKKPCHGCGEVPESYGGRPTEGVCASCSKLLEFAKKTKARLETNPEKGLYKLPWAHYELPYISKTDTAFYDEDPTPTTKFQKAIFRLIHAVAEIDNLNKRYGPEDHVVEGTKSHEGLGWLNPGVRDDLNTIYLSVMAMTEEAYAKGKKDGERFIVALATGDVSIERFNEVVTK